MPFALSLRRRRGERAYEAISRGLIAVGAGNVRPRASCGERTDRAARAAVALLRAQVAQLAGDLEAAEHTFRRWRAAPTPRRSACTDFSSRRGAATIW